LDKALALSPTDQTKTPNSLPVKLQATKMKQKCITYIYNVQKYKTKIKLHVITASEKLGLEK
jgi:hypothetical protein